MFQIIMTSWWWSYNDDSSWWCLFIPYKHVCLCHYDHVFHMIILVMIFLSYLFRLWSCPLMALRWYLFWIMIMLAHYVMIIVSIMILWSYMSLFMILGLPLLMIKHNFVNDLMIIPPILVIWESPCHVSDLMIIPMYAVSKAHLSYIT